MFDIEDKTIREGFEYLIGVDEAGRGPLAGPVVSSAVGIEADKFYEITENFKNKTGDSKKLSPLTRQKAYYEIIEKLDVGIGIIGHEVIDKINILEATKLSMLKAVNSLKNKTENYCVLIDGNMKLKKEKNYVDIIKGDSICFTVGCASIIAKVVRDEIMDAYAKMYPKYGFESHKGYGTKKHIEAIKKFGIVSIHRKSFSPCKI